MKRVILLTALLCLSLGATAREVTNINRGWRFFLNSEGSSERAFTVNMPHTWNNDALSGKRDYSRAVGNYVQTINAPAQWKDKRVFIKFYGANAITTLLVNGRTAGEHRGGYTTFAFEITELILPGRENSLWLMVNNSPQTDLLPTAGDMNSYGGCFRDVELIVTNPIALSIKDNGSQGVYVVQQNISAAEAQGEVVLKIDGPGDKVVTAQVAIFTDKLDTVGVYTARSRVSGGSMEQVKVPFSISNPQLWDGVSNPFMYNVGVKLMVDTKVSDSIVVRTGFRHYSIDPQIGFVLNGKPYKLNGVSLTQDRAMVGSALTRYQIEEDMKIVREIGANAVRVMELPHNPYFYELCDREGVVVWSDLPWVGPAYFTDRQYLDTPGFKANGQTQLREIIRQQYNHPSVVVWGIFSNLNLRGDNPIPYIETLNNMAKTEDPSRLTGAVSSEDGKMNFITDVVLWNHSMGWKEGQPDDINMWLGQIEKNWKNLNSAITYSAGGSIYQQDDSLARPAYLGSWHPERWQTYFHEQYLKNTHSQKYLWSRFVGNLFDYGAAGRDWGEGNGTNDCGLVTFDRKYRKDAFYLYKANWNSEDKFVYIAEKRWERRKSATQEIRVYSNCDKVELWVNGIMQGVQSGVNGIFTWAKVTLGSGENNIEARSAEGSDSSIIYISSRKHLTDG